MYIRVNGKEVSEFNQKDIILFGCGSCGLRTLEEFENVGSNIIAFCDNNMDLVGSTFHGYKVISPAQLKEYSNIDIVITSTYEDEIENQLKGMGIHNYYQIKLGVLKETIAKEKFHNKLLTNEEANQYIYDRLQEERPFFIGRLGSVELECISHYLYFLDRKYKREKYPNNVKMMMNINAGFFPTTSDSLDKFSEMYISNMKDMDLIWSMWFSKYENIIYQDFYQDKLIVDYDKTAFPIEMKEPWTNALKSKKILVIHPFEKSIIKNYLIKDKLFEIKFLPDFELKTYKAIQSIAGNKTDFDSWFAALEHMNKQIEKIDFDIALIGAGAYGLPLGYHVKKMGKKALHIGGVLQLFFGIKGKAWDKLGIYNESWTKPLLEEKPVGFNNVEAGRYW